MIGVGVGTTAFNAQYLTSRYMGQSARVKNNRQFSAYLNGLDAMIEFDYVCQVFCARFLWEGDEIDWMPEGYIERQLFFSPMVVGFKHPKYGFCVLPAYPNTLNFIGEPAEVIAQAYTESYTLQPDEYVLMKDTNTYSCPSTVVERKTALVADAGRTIETYMNGLKKPMVMVTDDKNKITNQEIAKQIMNNFPYILASNKGQAGETLRENAPIFHNSTHNGGDLLALIQARKALLGDVLGKIAIDSNQTVKGQYQSEQELDSASFFTDVLSVGQAVRNREKFVKEVSEKFGITLRVTNVLEMLKEEQQQEGSDDGDDTDKGEDDGEASGSTKLARVK